MDSAQTSAQPLDDPDALDAAERQAAVEAAAAALLEASSWRVG